jgi:hypothetical protein
MKLEKFNEQLDLPMQFPLKSETKPAEFNAFTEQSNIEDPNGRSAIVGH